MMPNTRFKFKRPFRQLRGKLTLSYTLTSVMTFLLVETIFIGGILLFSSLNVAQYALNDLNQEAPQANPYFVHGSPDREALTSWLSIVSANMPRQGPYDQFQPIFLSVVDPQGLTLASVGSSSLPLNSPLKTRISSQNWANLDHVLQDQTGKTSTASSEVNDTLVIVSPIMDTQGKILHGALVLKMAIPDRLHLVSYYLFATIISVTFVTTIAAIAGLIFGNLVARGLTRRLKHLSTAAERWSEGDFSILSPDTSADELGQLGRRLNQMAAQLQNLIQTRQKLATLEERNRLARDLHDSVKQQIFAIAMQIGATKLLLSSDPAAAETRLSVAEKLIHQSQQELTSLIRELRPAALESKGLVIALRELATQWTEQSNIVANVLVEGTQPIPSTVEEALFRVAQEALANAERHSQATLVQLRLNITADLVTLSVTDNGHGFDLADPVLKGQGRSGVGLLSMQERLKALGGDVIIESTLGKGTKIVAQCHRLGITTVEELNSEGKTDD